MEIVSVCTQYALTAVQQEDENHEISGLSMNPMSAHKIFSWLKSKFMIYFSNQN